MVKSQEKLKIKYNQSQEEFKKSDKYIKYLNKFNNWKSCVDSLNNLRQYSSKLKFDENKNVIVDTILVEENKNKDALYSSAREWVVSTFNSATDVLKMDDSVSGKLIAKGFTTITVETGIMKHEINISNSTHCTKKCDRN